MDKPIVKHSNAPPPITPVRGSSYITPTWKKADWNHWEQMPHSHIWDIVALSLDLEPFSPAHNKHNLPPEYDKRLQITNAHIECGKLTRSKAGWDSIDMTTYGTWAQSLGWSLPEKFPCGEVAKKSALIEELTMPQAINGATNLWSLKDPKDPDPKQDWYTPARFFAREQVRKDTTLLTKRNLLAEKVSLSLLNAGIYGRTKNKKFDGSTIKKAFVNVILV